MRDRVEYDDEEKQHLLALLDVNSKTISPSSAFLQYVTVQGKRHGNKGPKRIPSERQVMELVKNLNSLSLVKKYRIMGHGNLLARSQVKKDAPVLGITYVENKPVEMIKLVNRLKSSIYFSFFINVPRGNHVVVPLEALRKELRDNHDVELKELRDNHDVELKELRENHDVEIKELRENHDVELKELRQDHFVALEELRQDHFVALEALKLEMTTMSLSLEKINEANDGKMQTLRDEVKTLEDSKAALDREMQTLRDEVKTLEDSKKALEGTPDGFDNRILRKNNANLEHSISLLQAELEKLNNAYIVCQDKVNNLQAESQVEIDFRGQGGRTNQCQAALNTIMDGPLWLVEISENENAIKVFLLSAYMDQQLQEYMAEVTDIEFPPNARPRKNECKTSEVNLGLRILMNKLRFLWTLGGWNRLALPVYEKFPNSFASDCRLARTIPVDIESINHYVTIRNKADHNLVNPGVDALNKMYAFHLDISSKLTSAIKDAQLVADVVFENHVRTRSEQGNNEEYNQSQSSSSY